MKDSLQDTKALLLSEREKQVFKFVAEGLSNKEIAVNMRVSPSTVKRHVENILRKLSLRNRVEAAVYAISETTRRTRSLPEQSARGNRK